MRFTAHQYDEAIENLRLAKEQLEPNGNCCTVCGDSGHMAFECGFNPLVAMSVCKSAAKSAYDLHEKLHESDTVAHIDAHDGETSELHHFLHWLAGYDIRFGVQCGPACVVMPDPEPEPTPGTAT